MNMFPSLSKYTSSPVKPSDLQYIRYIMVGAAPLSPELTLALEKVMPDSSAIGQGYGLTESSTVITCLPRDRHRSVPGSAGRLLTNCVARVLKSDGKWGGVGEEGELVVKLPPTEHNYYLDNPEANKETFVDGWLK